MGNSPSGDSRERSSNGPSLAARLTIAVLSGVVAIAGLAAVGAGASDSSGLTRDVVYPSPPDTGTVGGPPPTSSTSPPSSEGENKKKKKCKKKDATASKKKCKKKK